MAIVTIVARRSETGNEVQTPSTPMNDGSQSSNGIRNITWRIRLRNIALPDEPRLWKNVVAIIWNPTVPNAQRESRRQLDDTSIR